VAAYVFLVTYGVVGPDDTPLYVARQGLTFLVPFAFGASLANTVLSESSSDRSADDDESHSDGALSRWDGRRRDVAAFVFGALFIAFPLAPIDEVPLYASMMGWERVLGTTAASLSLTYLTLYTVEFKRQADRLRGRTPVTQVGETCVVYLVGLTIAAVLLAGFGQLGDQPFTVMVREVLVLGFPSTLGAGGAGVLLS
jgi:uncharacterized membrane protein